MCGIVGIFGGDLSKINDANFAIKHRGPDDFGVYTNSSSMVSLGHRRLSIIDTSSFGHQPMNSSDGKVIIVFNGEIYNYKELRSNLQKKGFDFRGDSDTEVLLNLYISEGKEMLTKLNGIFSFAIWDSNSNLLFVARDAMGVKPLYYFSEDGVFAFASEIKALLELTSKDKELNFESINHYLSFLWCPGSGTPLKSIHKVLPGEAIIIEKGNIIYKWLWYELPVFKKISKDLSKEQAILGAADHLRKAVHRQMISDVPFGAFLSGGVDSSVITSIMSKNSSTPIKTYSIGFEEKGYNEFEYANIIASKFKTDHHEIVMNGDDYMETMDELISYKDAPLSVPNEVPLYLMCKELKKDITVVLSGEGADEIFGGYGRIFRSTDDYEKLKNIDSQNISDTEKESFCKSLLMKYATTEFSNELDHFMNIYSYTSYKEKCDLLHSDCNLQDTESILYKKFLDYFDEISDESYLNKMMYVFEKVHLLGLLHRVDTTSMAASVEARVPFVDHRLVEFAFTIPEKYKLKWTKNNKPPFHLMSDEISEVYDVPKYILKKCYEGKIPDEVLYRKKVGFPVPLNTWFGGNFRKYAKDILLSERANSRKIFNSKNIEKWIDSDSLSRSHGDAMKIWMLINLEIFCSRYFN